MSRSVVEHPLVTEYLSALRRQAASLPESRRTELIEEIGAHIEGSLPEIPSEAQIRNILDRLGTPEEIVDAELDDPQALSEPSAQPGSPMGPWTASGATQRAPLATGDIVGLTLLLLGGAVALPVGYLIGTALVGASRRWSVLARVVLVALPCVVALVATALLAVEGMWDSPADLVSDPFETLQGWLDLGLVALPYTAVQVGALIAVWFLYRRTEGTSSR